MIGLPTERSMGARMEVQQSILSLGSAHRSLCDAVLWEGGQAAGRSGGETRRSTERAAVTEVQSQPQPSTLCVPVGCPFAHPGGRRQDSPECGAPTLQEQDVEGRRGLRSKGNEGTTGTRALNTGGLHEFCQARGPDTAQGIGNAALRTQAALQTASRGAKSAEKTKSRPRRVRSRIVGGIPPGRPQKPLLGGPRRGELDALLQH